MPAKFLVAAALQEELNSFLSLFDNSPVAIGYDVEKVILHQDKQAIEVLTYSPNKMGMPIVAARLMKVIMEIKPTIVIFIGTCARMNEKNELGTVLVPVRAFAYEAGKIQDGNFHSDYKSYDFSERLIKKASEFKDRKQYPEFQIVTDEEICSGASVVDDEKRLKEIHTTMPRKIAGLDMEAYAIAYLNQIFINQNCDLVVAKGISDSGKNKNQTEKDGYKNIAKENSAMFALEFIKFLNDGAKNQEAKTDSEKIVYNSTTNQGPIALKGKGGKLWNVIEKSNVGKRGEGSLETDDKVIIIHRSNTDGRYELRLHSYTFEGKQYEMILRNQKISGFRKLKIKLSVKSDDSEHSISFNFKEDTNGKLIATKTIRITSKSWTFVELDFNLNPSVDCYLRIDDFNVSRAPSNLYLQDIIIYDMTNLR